MNEFERRINERIQYWEYYINEIKKEIHKFENLIKEKELTINKYDSKPEFDTNQLLNNIFEYIVEIHMRENSIKKMELIIETFNDGLEIVNTGLVLNDEGKQELVSLYCEAVMCKNCKIKNNKKGFRCYTDANEALSLILENEG